GDGDVLVGDDARQLDRHGRSRLVLEVAPTATGNEPTYEHPAGEEHRKADPPSLCDSPHPSVVTLSEPDRRTLGGQPIHLELDPSPDLPRQRLHELDVVGVPGSVSVERHGLQKTELELGWKVHQTGRQAEVREGVVDGEVDEPGEPL